MNAPLPNEVLPSYERRPVPPAMLDALRERFGQRCSTAAAVREQHGRDESPFPVTPPDAVVFCENTDEVAFVVQQAAAHAVPVIPFGIGSSLEGHLLAVQGGVSVDLSRMTRIVRLNQVASVTPKLLVRVRGSSATSFTACRGPARIWPCSYRAARNSARWH
jgi:D-lactate dehydrogenase (cytochrome)